MSHAPQVVLTPKTSKNSGFSVCTAGRAQPLDNIFKTALGRMLATKDWPLASQNLSELKQQAVSSASPSKTTADLKTTADERKKPATQVPAAKNDLERSSRSRSLRVKREAVPQVMNLLTQAGLDPKELPRLASQVPREDGTIDLPELLNQAVQIQANGAPLTHLQLPAEQLPQWLDLLAQAGISREAAQEFFTPAFTQGQAISLQSLSAWLQGQAQATQPAPLPNTLTQLTTSPGFTRRWENLAVSAADLPQIQTLLQKAGAPAQVLAQIQDAAGKPGGSVRLADILPLLKGTTHSGGQAAGVPADRAVTLQDMDGWRDLFIKAGLDPAQADQLVSHLSPGSAHKTLEVLGNLAPPATPKATVTTSPKPEYYVGQKLFEPEAGQNATPQQDFLAGGQENPTSPELPLPNTLGQPGMPPLNPAMAFTLSPLPAGIPAAPAGPATASATWGLMGPQLQAGLLQQAQSGTTQLRLALNPPSLGELQINLVQKGGALQATVVTANQTVAEALAQNSTDLRQTLAQHGLNLNQIQVVMSSPATADTLPVRLAGVSRPGTLAGRPGDYRRSQDRVTTRSSRLASVNSYA